MVERSLLQVFLGDEELEALFSDKSDLAAMVRFEVALAGAQADAGLIASTAATAIKACLENFTPDWAGLAAGMAVDGVVVPALVKQLRAAVEQPYGQLVHTGATSQDVVDTSLIIRLAQVIAILVDRLTALERRFDRTTQKFGTRKLTAHTRMQVALPITVADKIATWAQPLLWHRASLDAIRQKLLVVQFGGPVGNREGFDGKGDQVAKYLASRLELGLAESWHSQRGPLVELGSLASLISGSLGKFGVDVTLLAQNEIASIKLSGGGGSSAMAHKSNPVNAEALVTLARHSAGATGTLHQAMVHENERSGAAWTLEWLILPQLLINAGSSLRLADKLLSQIEDFGDPSQ